MKLSDLFKPNIEKLESKRNVKRLIKVLRIKRGQVNYDIKWFERNRATEALGRIGDKSAVDPLIEHLNNSSGFEKRIIIESLGKIGDSKAFEPIIKYLNDSNQEIRECVVKIIIKLGDTRAIDALVLSLKDPSIAVRKAAVNALKDFGWAPLDDEENIMYLMAKEEWDEIVKIGEAAVEILNKAFKDICKWNLGGDKISARIQVLLILGKIGDTRAIDSLIELLNDKEFMIRHRAVKALGNLGDARAVDALIKLLNDKELIIRRSAVEALGILGNESRVEHLISSVNSSSWKYYEREYIDNFGPSIKSFNPWWNESAIIDLGKLAELWKDFEREIIDTLGKIGDKRAVEPLIKSLKTSLSNESTIIALGKLADRRAVEPLIEVYKSTQVTNHIKDIALVALIEIGDASVIEHLIKLLENEICSFDAVKALNKLGDERAVEPLISLLNNSTGKGYGYESIIIDTLGKIGDKRAIEPLIKSLNSRWNLSAIIALEKLADKTAVEPLIEVLKDEQNKDINFTIRIHAVKALGNLGDSRAVDSLCKVLDSPAVTEQVIIALEKIGDKRAIEPLIHYCRFHCDLWKYHYDSALKAVAKIKKLTGETLIELLEDSNNKVREDAVFILGKEKNKRAVEFFSKLVNDQDQDVRSTVVEALGNIGDAKAVEVVCKFLQDKDCKIRKSAAKILHKNGWISTNSVDKIFFLIADWKWDQLVVIGKYAIEPLISVLEEEEEEDKYTRFIIRYNSVRILRKIGGSTEKVEPFIKLLKDENSDIRGYAAGCLGNIGNPKTIIHLIQLINDVDGFVRKSTSEALEKLGWTPSNKEEEILYLIATAEWNKLVTLGKDAIHPLIDVLKDTTEDTRKQVLTTLGDIGDKCAVEALIEYLKKWCYWEAAISLGKIGDRRAAEPILKFLLNNISKYEPSNFNYRCQAFSNLFGIYTKIILNCFTYFYSGNDGKSRNLEQGENDIVQLTQFRTSIANNILHLITEIKDLRISVYTNYENDAASIDDTISFYNVRKIASKELKLRGNPPYNPYVFLDEKEWTK